MQCNQILALCISIRLRDLCEDSALRKSIIEQSSVVLLKVTEKNKLN